MKLLRHLLFVVLQLLVQSGALIHATDHLRPDVDLPASHSCALCIAAQGLDTPMASAAASVTASVHGVAPMADAIVPVFAAPDVSPRARAPPVA